MRVPFIFFLLLMIFSAFGTVSAKPNNALGTKGEVVAVAENIMDIIVKFNSKEEFYKYLKSFGVKEGEFRLISSDLSKDFLQKLQSSKEVDFTISPGGSLLNTVSVLSAIGLNTSVIGSVGDDEFGKLTRDSLQKIKIDLCFTYCMTHGTSISLILVSPEGSKTMLTSAKCFSEFDSSIINYTKLNNQRLFIAEAFLLNHSNSRALLHDLFKHSKKYGVETAFALSNKEVVVNFKDIINELIQDVDILIGNQGEFLALTGASSINEILPLLKLTKRLNIVTLGENGVLVIDARDSNNIIVFKMPSILVNNVVDLTGAGDNFAAGFFYGYLNGYSLEQSALIGNIFGSATVQQIGARLHEPKNVLENILN